jgi:hypothetical protein
MTAAPEQATCLELVLLQRSARVKVEPTEDPVPRAMECAAYVSIENMAHTLYITLTLCFFDAYIRDI